MLTNLLLALVFFVLSHAVPALPGVRQTLIGRLGRPAYLSVYILISLGAFTWLILAALAAPSWLIWEPVEIHFALAFVCMLLSCMALALGLTSANPLSLSVRPSETGDLPVSGLSWTRHPLLWALVLWSFGHILANGDTTGLLLFGTLGGFAAAYMPILDGRKKRVLGEAVWTRLAQTAPLVPFTGQSRPSFDGPSLRALILGLLLFAGLLAAHEPVIGISPIWIFTR